MNRLDNVSDMASRIRVLEEENKSLTKKNSILEEQNEKIQALYHSTLHDNQNSRGQLSSLEQRVARYEEDNVRRAAEDVQRAARYEEDNVRRAAEDVRRDASDVQRAAEDVRRDASDVRRDQQIAFLMARLQLAPTSAQPPIDAESNSAPAANNREAPRFSVPLQAAGERVAPEILAAHPGVTVESNVTHFFASGISQPSVRITMNLSAIRALKCDAAGTPLTPRSADTLKQSTLNLSLDRTLCELSNR